MLIRTRAGQRCISLPQTEPEAERINSEEEEQGGEAGKNRCMVLLKSHVQFGHTNSTKLIALLKELGEHEKGDDKRLDIVDKEMIALLKKTGS